MPSPRIVLVWALCALAATACRSVPATTGAASGARLPAILARGELRVGLTGEQAPLNMRTPGGGLAGLEVDLANALAQSMGVRARFVELPFAELLPALERGDVDLVASGVTITPERNARVAFAGPYFVTGTAILSRDAALAEAEHGPALDAPGRRYVALAGSTSESFVREWLPQAQLQSVPDYESAVRMVIDGKADAMVGDFLACAMAVWRHPEAGLVPPSSPLTAEPIGVAIAAGDPLLVNLVENYLDTLEQTGLLTQLKARWLSDGAWLRELR